jgi:hypothetical protein
MDLPEGLGLFDLTGRRALVTGGSRGIGRAACLGLARAGADVAVHYHQAAAEAEAVVAEIRALGRRSLAVRADVARAQDREASGCRAVQYVPDLVLEHLDLDGALTLAPYPDHVQEVAHTLGRKATPPQCRDGGHARIVPASHVTPAHEPPQEALREHGVGEIEAAELVLARV